MTRITLFGSSFNPPHIGHALVIQDFLSQGLTDELWLLPTNIHSFGKDLAPTNHRLEMTKLFLKSLTSNPKPQAPIRLCPIEIDLNLSSQTIDTLKALKETDYTKSKMNLEFRIKNLEFSFLMGSDQLPHFQRWGQWQTLLEQMKFYVYPRANHDNSPLLDNMELIEFSGQTITNLSSSLTRSRLQTNNSTQHLLSEPIRAYIKKHNIYT